MLKTLGKMLLGKPNVTDPEEVAKHAESQFIKNIHRLRLAYEGDNKRQIALLSRWLANRGAGVPASISECNTEIARLSVA